MNKFIILGEDWHNLLTEKTITMILVTSVPDSENLMTSMINYLQEKHPTLFLRSYYDKDRLVLGILKPQPPDLKDLLEPDVLIGFGGDMIIEVEMNEVHHISIVKADEQEKLYECLSSFMQINPRKKKLFNKNNDDNRD